MSCAKLLTIAIIKNGNEFFVGSNACRNPQEICPRKDMPTGHGYELCETICQQWSHAEVAACINAGDKANGADLYLIGHSYCCDNCKAVMKEHGIKNTYIVDSMREALDERT